MQDTKSMHVKHARAWVDELTRSGDKAGVGIINLALIDQPGLSLADRREMFKRKQGRNQRFFDKNTVNKILILELMMEGSESSFVKRSAVRMADTVVQAAEVLDKSQEIFEHSLAAFSKASDEAIEDAKKRVSQLNDYNNRLATSLLNLNKTLGDERMARALENADRIAAALKLLDDLEKTGRLGKIMEAMAH